MKMTVILAALAAVCGWAYLMSYDAAVAGDVADCIMSAHVELPPSVACPSF